MSLGIVFEYILVNVVYLRGDWGMNAKFRKTNLVEEILDAFLEVQRNLGNEFSNEVYENALSLALKVRGIKVDRDEKI